MQIFIQATNRPKNSSWLTLSLTEIKLGVSTAAASVVRALFFSNGQSKWKEDFAPSGAFIVTSERQENGFFLILQRHSLFHRADGLF